MPVQNTGKEMPAKEKNMIILLTNELGLIEAIIPSGIPTNIEIIIAIIANSRVAGILSNTMSRAGCPYTNEFPRFPCKA